MAVINVLDRHIAELIAAGEVVERPASVVKELCENSIDAGSKNICVTIENGGITLIEISDDGLGIEADYVSTAFLRHATSKLKTQNDLDNIHTLGFRGEALASVASVAKVELITRAENAEFASIYRIEGGEEICMEAAARGVGTTIRVHNIFYNTPARMKFLKKDSSEGNFVNDVVTELAISHPEISFKFVREGKIQFNTSGDSDLRSTAYEILGRDFAKDLVKIAQSTGNYSVSGLVTLPQFGRASRGMQHFFVNGRFVKNRTIMAALESAYRGMIMQGKFPGGILFVSMPHELVDVNVHPAKTEIRFARESDVFDAVYSAVRSAVQAPAADARELEIKSNVDTKQTINDTSKILEVKQTNFTHKENADNSFNYSKIAGASPNVLKSECAIKYNTNSTEKIDVEYLDLHEENVKNVIVVPEEKIVQTEIANVKNEDAKLNFVGEVFDTYIIAQQSDEIYFIDKHAAHERILYEKLVKNYGDVDAQLLLEPITITLNAQEKNAILQNADVLDKSGIEIEDFGGMCVLVRSVPANIRHDNIDDLILELADNFIDSKKNVRDEKTQWVLHSIACRAAVKAGDKQSSEELINLAEQIMNGAMPLFCPHGRPVLLKITLKELEKQFGRQG